MYERLCIVLCIKGKTLRPASNTLMTRTYITISKAYFISPTNSLTLPKSEKCSMVKQNFTSFVR